MLAHVPGIFPVMFNVAPSGPKQALLTSVRVMTSLVMSGFTCIAVHCSGSSDIRFVVSTDDICVQVRQAKVDGVRLIIICQYKSMESINYLSRFIENGHLAHLMDIKNKVKLILYVGLRFSVENHIGTLTFYESISSFSFWSIKFNSNLVLINNLCSEFYRLFLNSVKLTKLKLDYLE